MKGTRKIIHPFINRAACCGLIVACLLSLTGCYRSLGYQGLPTSSPGTPTLVTPDIIRMPTKSLTPTPSGQVTLMAVGDIMLGRLIGELIQTAGPQAPFLHVSELFHSADWVIANLECAITNSTTPVSKRYTFAAPLVAGTGLAESGINVINLSNNHTLDYGQEGLLDTRTVLQENGIRNFGVGKDAVSARTPLILKKNGLTIALLGYTDVPIETSSYFDTRSWIANDEHAGLAWANLSDIQLDVAAARQQSDLVIVYFHYGVENLDHASRSQHQLATTAIDAGASLVLGSHTHRLQEIEHYNGGLIVYGLGNFIFDGFDEIDNLSAILSVRMGKTGVIEFTWYPMVIVNGIPQPADEANARVIHAVVAREYKVYLPGLEPGDITE